MMFKRVRLLLMSVLVVQRESLQWRCDENNHASVCMLIAALCKAGLTDDIAYVNATHLKQICLK